MARAAFPNKYQVIKLVLGIVMVKRRTNRSTIGLELCFIYNPLKKHERVRH